VTDSIKDVTKIAHMPYTTISRALNCPRISAQSTVQIKRIIAGMGDPPRPVGHSLVILRPCASGVALITIHDLFHGDNLFPYNAGAETASFLPA
jgi:DNA-binding LacI/PurR family transcriptional regulator